MYNHEGGDMSYLGYVNLMTTFLEKFDNPKVLEIGVDKGQTTLPLLANLVSSGRPFKYAGVDILVRNDLIEQVCALKGVQLGNPIKYDGVAYSRENWNTYLFESNSMKELPTWVKCGWKFDLILIDGDHNYHTVLEDLKNAQHLAHPGTLFIIDDYNGRFAENDLFYSEKPEYSNKNLGDRQTLTTEGKVGVRAAVNDWYTHHLVPTEPTMTWVFNTSHDPAIMFNSQAVQITGTAHELYPFLCDRNYTVEVDPNYTDCSFWNCIVRVDHVNDGAVIHYVINPKARHLFRDEDVLLKVSDENAVNVDHDV